MSTVITHHVVFPIQDTIRYWHVRSVLESTCGLRRIPVFPWITCIQPMLADIGLSFGSYWSKGLQDSPSDFYFQTVL